MKRIFLILLVLLLIPCVPADTMIIYVTHDGYVLEGTDAAWFTIARDVGENAIDGGASLYGRMLATASDSNPVNISYNRRAVLSFNGSDLGASATITNAVVTVKGGSKTNTLGTFGASLIDGFPANPLDYVGADYDNTGYVRQASDIAYASWSITSWNNWTLSNLTHISKTGIFSYFVTTSADVDLIQTTWSSTGGSGYTMSGMDDGTNDPFITITYTTGAAPDTTPPDSITGLTNTTTNCNNITWGWTNPTTADFNHTMIWRNNTFWTNVSNITTTAFWDGLPENTAMTFSSRTCDFIPNCNLTFVNATKTTNFCPVATPTPTPTPTATPTPAPTPALAGCLYYNLTGVYEGLNSSNWTATEGLTTWGVMTTNASQGNTSWWVCIATPTPTPTPQPWQPDINPTTDTHYNWWKQLTDWWWLPLLILVMIILFTRR